MFFTGWLFNYQLGRLFQKWNGFKSLSAILNIHFKDQSRQLSLVFCRARQKQGCWWNQATILEVS